MLLQEGNSNIYLVKNIFFRQFCYEYVSKFHENLATRGKYPLTGQARVTFGEDVLQKKTISRLSFLDGF